MHIAFQAAEMQTHSLWSVGEGVGTAAQEVMSFARNRS